MFTAIYFQVKKQVSNSIICKCLTKFDFTGCGLFIVSSFLKYHTYDFQVTLKSIHKMQPKCKSITQSKIRISDSQIFHRLNSQFSKL